MYHCLWSHQGCSAQTPKQQHVFIWRHTTLAFLHLSIHYGTHTQTLQCTSPWDCWLKISCTRQLWIALTKSTMQPHITQANLCREQENGRVRKHSAFHSGSNLHPSESISGRYSWTCLCGLMLIHAYVFALVQFLCICPPMLLLFVPVVTLEWNMDVLPPIWVQRNGFGLGLLCSI